MYHYIFRPDVFYYKTSMCKSLLDCFKIKLIFLDSPTYCSLIYYTSRYFIRLQTVRVSCALFFACLYHSTDNNLTFSANVNAVTSLHYYLSIAQTEVRSLSEQVIQ